MSPKLFIRADSATTIGIGHMMRCIAIAQAWQERGGSVTFLSHCQSEVLRRRIREEGCEFVYVDCPHPDPKDLKQVIEWLQDSRIGAKDGWFVLDGYCFGADYQKVIKKAGLNLLLVDDYGHSDHYFADIVLNQNIYSEEGWYVRREPYTRLLLGPSYVLLRREFLMWREWKRTVPAAARKVLVTLGGADQENVTSEVVRALNGLGLSDLKVKIIVGPLNPHIEAIESELDSSLFDFEVLSTVENMSSLLAWADLAVSGGGSTCWELAFMGVPFLVLILAENQVGIARGLAEAGAAMNCDWFHSLSENAFSMHLQEMLMDYSLRRAYSSKGRQLVDGLGTERVLDQMSRC